MDAHVKETSIHDICIHETSIQDIHAIIKWTPVYIMMNSRKLRLRLKEMVPDLLIIIAF